jgi:hypothetical protein
MSVQSVVTCLVQGLGCACSSYLRRLVVGFPPRRANSDPRSGHVRFVVDKVAGFLRVFRFPLPILIPPTAPHSSWSMIRCWYNRPVNGRRTNWSQSRSIGRIKNKTVSIVAYRPVARQQILTDVTVECNNRKAVFSMWSVPRCCKQGTKSVDREFCTEGCEERAWVREAEEYPLLEAGARERLIRTQEA